MYIEINRYTSPWSSPPSEKRRGDSKSLPPHGGQTVSFGQILLMTQSQYSMFIGYPQEMISGFDGFRVD